MLKKVKHHLQKIELIHSAVELVRKHQLYSEYHNRREWYRKLCVDKSIVYNETQLVLAIQGHLCARGYIPAQREIGHIHTFACIPQFSWHSQLLPDLIELGPVTLFDYCSHGFRHDEFAFNGSRGYERRKQMLDLLWVSFQTAHESRPVDWLLCYGGGQEISAELIRRITECYGIPTVNMTFDDKHGWVGPSVGEHRTGAADITAEFDLFATSARVACEWHMVEGGRPIYMPEGVDVNHYSPSGVTQDIPVSFVGGAYGFRPRIVRDLNRYGVHVKTYGDGWKNSGWIKSSVDIFNRSIINIGMGGIGYAERLTNVKGRDFEIPGTGGGVYLTSFNADLAQHFIVGSEILCYHSLDELIELIRYYLARPDEAAAIAYNARERCIKEHRWIHRYKKMLTILGILKDTG
jgi:hypothetical protein